MKTQLVLQCARWFHKRRDIMSKDQPSSIGKCHWACSVGDEVGPTGVVGSRRSLGEGGVSTEAVLRRAALRRYAGRIGTDFLEQISSCGVFVHWAPWTKAEERMICSCHPDTTPKHVTMPSTRSSAALFYTRLNPNPTNWCLHPLGGFRPTFHRSSCPGLLWRPGGTLCPEIRGNRRSIAWTTWDQPIDLDLGRHLLTIVARFIK